MSTKQAIRDWWAQHPMTYADTHGHLEYAGVVYDPHSLAFFDQVDQTFYAWNKPLHRQKPFDGLFPYGQYPPGSRVLEIGCGMGTMAMNWAQHHVDMVAVDLNPPR